MGFESNVCLIKFVEVLNKIKCLITVQASKFSEPLTYDWYRIKSVLPVGGQIKWFFNGTATGGAFVFIKRDNTTLSKIMECHRGFRGNCPAPI